MHRKTCTSQTEIRRIHNIDSNCMRFFLMKSGEPVAFRRSQCLTQCLKCWHECLKFMNVCMDVWSMFSIFKHRHFFSESTTCTREQPKHWLSKRIGKHSSKHSKYPNIYINIHVNIEKWPNIHREHRHQHPVSIKHWV